MNIIIILSILWIVLSFIYFIFFQKKNEKNIIVVNDSISTEQDAIKNDIIAMPKKFAVKIILSDEKDKSIINDNVMVDMVLKMEDLIKGNYKLPDNLIKNNVIENTIKPIVPSAVNENTDDDYLDINTFNV
ncbi:MAG: hypothetical protein ACK4K9_10095 [Bacteroidia bacterium]